MKILITGATGLVGSELISLLLQKGIAVHYLSTSKSKMNTLRGAIGFFWDPAAGIIDENSLMGVDAIIHLVGASVFSRWNSDYKQEIIESRTLSANLLYKALKNYPNQVRTIVSASAIGIYPQHTAKALDETETRTDDTFLAAVVEQWEQSIDRFSRLNLNIVKLRTGLVLSERGGALPGFMKPLKYGIGTYFGSGKQVQSWIHIKDLAEMYLFAITNNWNGIYNAVAPTPVTQKNLLQKIAHKMQRFILLPGIPRFMMSLVLGQMHQLLYSSQNVSSRKATDSGFTFAFPDIDSALTDLISR